MEADDRELAKKCAFDARALLNDMQGNGHIDETDAMSAQLDERMARELRSMLQEMRDADPARYREMFANLIPLDALPSEAYSDRQLEVIYGAVVRGFARRAARLAATLN